MNRLKAQELLEEWQTRLGLQDWTITLRYNCDSSDMVLENVSGETSWNTSIKDASIRILSEKAFGNDRILNFDFEQILVHELLHLKFGLLDIENNSYESHVMETIRHQLIDDLARAMVMAKRGETTRNLACEKVKAMRHKDKHE